MKKMKEKNNFFKTLKPILIFSFLINIILLIFIFHLKSSHHLYLFAGDDEYLNIKSGVISLNYNYNFLEGNGITYIGEKDLNIKEIKIGYYILKDENLHEIISHYELFEKTTSLKDTIESITNLNVSEATKNDKMFKNVSNEDIENNLYVIMEIKTEDGEEIISKIDLDISKIS